MRRILGLLVVTVALVIPAGPAHAQESAPDEGRVFEPRPASVAELYEILPPDTDPDTQQKVLEAEDGIDLYVETWLPGEQAGRRPPPRIPTILIMTPYVTKGQEEYPNYFIEYFVPRGYAVAQHHVRGNGESGGCIEQTAAHQIDDGARVVEYLGRDAPWSDGNIGMFGISYDAETQISVAGLGDPEKTKYLKAIVPAASVGGQYEYSFFDGVPYFAQGPVSNGFYLIGSGQQTDFQNHPGHGPERLTCQPEIFAGSSEPSGDMTPFWAVREYRPGAGNIRAATLLVHGHSDFNVKPLTAAGFFERLPAATPHKGLFGIWPHAFPDRHASLRGEWHRVDWKPMVLAWYDRYLKGLDTGVESWPDVQVQGTDGRWRGEADWPQTGGPVGQLALGAGGELGATDPTGSTLYVEQVNNSASPMSRAVFQTGPLPDRLHITGQPVLDLWVSLGLPDAHIAAKLETFDAAGAPIVGGVDYGLRSARHVEPLVDNRFAQQQGVEPPIDTPINIAVRFFPTDIVVPKGGSARLTVSGSTTLNLVATVPSGLPTPVTILHSCDTPSVLRFLTARSDLDLLDVREEDEEEAPALAGLPAPRLAVDGGVASAKVCGKSALRHEILGSAKPYARRDFAPARPVPRPRPPTSSGGERLPTTGADTPIAALLLALGAGAVHRRRKA